ncbi:polysaccharide biosynthesis tyrosine autokinase [Prochlorococcus marinus XMU1412]|uniref:GumC family protein n=1 Tax=Prochlorococcus marinus TaxID=1219 RepID=UPI001ADC0E95|nr:polysaccharide biosynthesis tyrosine autokinase [Prochlorococcus marinus]MBO8240563.1 polysaccharide biosynthesis tyrosine autokinase [Prochlorococcus marinus XMU1412]MBW3071798.1 chain-length determining protein [Prochlorococcus marinus str. MU1412]
MEKDNNNNDIKPKQQITDFSKFDADEINYKELFQGIVRKKKWAFATGIIVFLGIIGYTVKERITNPLYAGSFRILISDPINSSGKKNNDLISTESSTFFQELASGSRRYDVDTLIFLLKSPKFLEPLAKEFKISPTALSNSISISVPINTSRFRAPASILIVNLTTKNKSKGINLLKALSQTYLEESLRQRQQKLNDGLEFLNKQAPGIKDKENQLQTKLVAFRNKHKLIDPIREGESLKAQQRMIEKNIIDINSTISRLKDVRKEILNGSITATGFREQIGTGLSIADFDQSLLDQLIAVERELAIAKTKFTSKSSIVKGLKTRLNQIQPIILKNQIDAVDTAINLNESLLRNTKESLKQLELEFLKQPELIKEYKRIEGELLIASQDLIKLNSSIKSFELELAQSNIPWRLISSPKMSPSPIKPSFRRNLQFGLLISIIFGILAALLRDRMDHVFHSSKEIKDNLNYPILGEIPFIKSFSELRSEKSEMLSIMVGDGTQKEKFNNKKDIYQRFFYTEALRNLFTSIRFSNTDESIKLLTITSSLPKEGKSLLNVLLAKTLNDMGEKVLIIDADMRRPQIHSRLNLDNILGLSNLLTDNDINLEKVIQPLQNFKNLSVMTSGTIPPDPTRLLSSKRFKEILSEIKSSNKYDIILFDTPPVLGLADTILLSENLDGIILLVSLGSVDRSLPRESLMRLQTTKTNILGVVTNAIKDEYEFEYKRYGKYSKYGNYGIYNQYSSYQPIETYINYGKDKQQEIENISKQKGRSKKDGQYSVKEDKKEGKSKLIKSFSKNVINRFTKWLDS